MRILNGLAVSLLLAACVGIYTIPRFNYESLVTRQITVETAFQQFLERAGTITADVHRLSQHVNELGSQFTELTEMASRASALMDDLHQRILAIEAHPTRINTTEPANPRSREERGETPFECVTRFFHKATTTLIELPKELQEKATKVNAQILVQDGFEPFVDQLIAVGIIPQKTYQDIAPDTLSHLMRLYNFHKTTLSILDYDRDLHINELVDHYTSTSNYMQVPAGQSLTEAAKATVPGPGITRIVQLPELNVTRVFHFSVDDHPELAEWEIKREYAKLHLIREVDSLFTFIK